MERQGGATGGPDAHLGRVLSAGERNRLIAGETVRREVPWPGTAGPVALDGAFSGSRDLSSDISRVLMCGVDVSAWRRATDETARATAAPARRRATSTGS